MRLTAWIVELYTEVPHTINRLDYGSLYRVISFYLPRGLWSSIPSYLILLTAWIMVLYNELLQTINSLDYGAFYRIISYY
jgi:hypothetical protein